MGTFTTIITAIKLLIEAYKFLKGTISEAVFLNRLRSIKKAVKKAQSGTLSDRLHGGSDVEDNYNK